VSANSFFAGGAGQFGRVFYATLVRPGSKIEEQVAVKTMKCTLTVLANLSAR